MLRRRSSDSIENRRLDSWKEIASFFGRDERTVKRWERSRSLPVHRIPGGERGGVFAYTAELTQWLNTPLAAADNSAQELDAPPVEPVPADVSPPLAPNPAIAASPTSPTSTPWLKSALVAAGIVGVILSILHFAPFHLRGASPPPTNLARVTHPQNAEAEELYLRGRYYWNRRTGDDLNHAVEDFTQAIAHDPSDAKAYAGLADSYNLIREYSSMPESEAYPRAYAAASKAVALDDSLAEGHRALAFDLFYWKWDIPNALKEYQKAIQLDPNNVEAHHWYATALLDLGRYNESIAEIEHARTLDPTSPAILADRGLILFTSGDQSGGITALREIEQSEPQFLSPPRYLASAFLTQEDYPNFITETERAAAISKDPQALAIAKAARTGWTAGGKRPMLEAMKRAQQTWFDQGHTSGYELAYTCLLLGEKAEAIRYLKAALSARDTRLFLISRNRFQTELKDDPQFEQLKVQLQAYEH
ncbi:MAG: tetratricopeptide repeat protein [Acidobacteriaceae bacterium]|jgi:tetratricopeptide (TPR) repeat protein